MVLSAMESKSEAPLRSQTFYPVCVCRASEAGREAGEMGKKMGVGRGESVM